MLSILDYSWSIIMNQCSNILATSTVELDGNFIADIN